MGRHGRQAVDGCPPRPAAVRAGAAGLKRYQPADLTNFLLGPEFAQWLVGPIAHLATDEERRGVPGARRNDTDAAAIHRGVLGAARSQSRVPADGSEGHASTRRASEADKVFSEGTTLGRRTDRGTVFILYGSPDNPEYATSPTGMGPPIEIWSYPRKAEPGLDGQRPEQRYGFRQQEPDRFSGPSVPLPLAGRQEATGATPYASARPRLRALLAGCGIAIPPARVDNGMLARVMETSDDWIRERSGIETRLLRRAWRRRL